VTLVVAIRTREGAVLAADSQLTFRDAAARVVDRRRVTKLIARGPLVWGWAGDEDAQQDLAMQILEAGPIDLRRKRSEIKATVNALAGQVFAALDEPAEPSPAVCLVGARRRQGRRDADGAVRQGRAVRVPG
jgi:ATP-dependent protease HslVU (ClpYQ) peptidase subunit